MLLVIRFRLKINVANSTYVLSSDQISDQHFIKARKSEISEKDKGLLNEEVEVEDNQIELVVNILILFILNYFYLQQ